ncbi:hypothetical protein CLV58_12573 [Spirosoma oryzae]|uniref:Uncharacterized protein n=1 Tax=Spirosoma oryzae TaxID=1469603 RepID=A0A2T0S8U9_9BACT|nr:hypothetical protein [Spirosoma oryzae]PRY29811.1 hypothetical protein CLV58_12573 [Spirosoma oryzae]
MRTSKEIADQLNKKGWATDGSPGYTVKDSLRRFQASRVLPNGEPLSIDGGYGDQTEAALFGSYIPTGISLPVLAVKVATALVGVREVPLGSNKGPQVSMILNWVGLSGGYPWCAASSFFSYQQAAMQLCIKNPHPKNAGVLNLWELAGYNVPGMRRITKAEAITNPSLVTIGAQFILKLGDTAGHTGLVSGRSGLRLSTVEGNTNNDLVREGDGQFAINRRRIDDKSLLGFILYD